MDLNALLPFFNTTNLVAFFFKSFAIIFSFLYLVYAIVVLKQTQVMNTTLTVGRNGLISFISFLQVLIGLLLVVLAILVL
jgi:hypothetical protein